MRAGVVLAVLPLLAGSAAATEFKLKRPAGLQEDAAQIPDDNPITPEKVALGKKFFWDKRWSASGTVACVSCHRPDHGWSDSRSFSADFAGHPSPRHTPTIINRLFSDRQHWSGIGPSLEEQAGLDVNTTDEKLLRQLGSIPAYRAEFRAVFGRDFDPEGVVAYYDRGGEKNPWLSTDMKPLGLTARERTDLVEFMKALTGRIDPEVSRPPDLPK